MAGVVYAIVAPAFVQYVKVRPWVDPVVIAEAVRSTTNGEHTAAGLVIINVGTEPCEEILTFADGFERQPIALVRVKVYVPASRSEIVVLVPEPVIATPPGVRVSAQAPLDGNPLNTTLPVCFEHVILVTVPTTGAERLEAIVNV